MSLKLFLAKLNRRDTRFLPKFSSTAKFFIFLFFILTSAFFITHSLAAENVLKDNISAWKTGGNLNTWLGQDSLQINAVGILDALTDIKDAPDSVISGTSGGKPVAWIPGGLLGSTTNTIAALYNQPASGIEYLAQVKDNFLGKPAYAQTGGIGFQGLQPILPIWKAFRNIVYVLSSFIFIIIGIMIMLRVKVSPQAVISLQNAVPKLITSLILVTFSYAIAGLIIDLMYFLQSLTLALLFNGIGTPLTQNLFPAPSPGPVIGTNFSNLANTNFGTAFYLSIRSVSFAVISSLGGIISGILIAALGIGIIVPGLLGGIVGAIGIGAVIITLIICIFILVLIFKFLFGLFKCYVSLILEIILSPLEIGMGAFPNSKLGFSSWILNIIANAAVFPISLIFLVLINIIAQAASGGSLWTPDLITIGTSGSHLNFVPLAISLGGLALLPKLPEMIPQFIFMIKPSPWGQAIGQSFGDISKSGLTKFATRVTAESGANVLVDKYNERQRDGGKQTLLTSLIKPVIQAGEASGALSERHKFESDSEK
jgi:hypothetical protein